MNEHDPFKTMPLHPDMLDYITARLEREPVFRRKDISLESPQYPQQSWQEWFHTSTKKFEKRGITVADLENFKPPSFLFHLM